MTDRTIATKHGAKSPVLAASAFLRLVSPHRSWVRQAIDVEMRGFGFSEGALACRDLLLKLSASAFAPQLGDGFKLGLTYEFSTRDSTAPSYSYDDHRVLAKAIWSFAIDPWLPRAEAPVGHVPLDYHLAEAEVGERVQDLLRQDEAAQRSSSCGE